MKTYHYSVVEEQTRRGYILAVKDGTTSPDRAGTATTSRVHSSHLALFYDYRIKGRKKTIVMTFVSQNDGMKI